MTHHPRDWCDGHFEDCDECRTTRLRKDLELLVALVLLVFLLTLLTVQLAVAQEPPVLSTDPVMSGHPPTTYELPATG